MDQMDLNQATDLLWELYHRLSFEMTSEGLSPEEIETAKQKFDAVCDVLEVAEDLRRFKEQLKL